MQVIEAGCANRLLTSRADFTETIGHYGNNLQSTYATILKL
jgi:hypothetical protein